MLLKKHFVFLFFICFTCFGYGEVNENDIPNDSASTAIKIDANDLFSSLNLLSIQSNISIFFAPDLTNKPGIFRYAGKKDIPRICQLLANHYQVHVERVDQSLIISNVVKHQQTNTDVSPPPKNQETKNSLEEVIVTASLQEKRTATSYQSRADLHPDESVRVEELLLSSMASQQVNNLAEALVTVPGIAANYDGGEGRQIAMRGLNGDFIHVAVNGMQTLAIHGSTLDSREQNERALAFDFNVLPSDLFGRLEVVRDYSVVQDSGGIAGNISLYTFDGSRLPNNDSVFNVVVEHSRSDVSMGGGKRGALSWQLKHDNWFYMLGASYQNKIAQEQGYNTYRWQRLDVGDTDISAVPTDIQEKLRNRQIYFPRGNRYSVWINDISQVGFVGALHYKRSNYSHKIDWIYSGFHNNKQEYHLATRGLSTTAVSATPDVVTQINELTVDKNNYLTYADFTDAQLATESRSLEKRTDFSQVTWNGDYRLSPALSFDWILGASRNDLFVPVDQKVFLRSFAPLTTDYSSDSTYPSNSYGRDLMDMSHWQLDEIDLQANKNVVTQHQASFNVRYLDGSSRWNMGLQWKRFVDKRTLLEQADLYKTQFNSGLLDNRIEADFSTQVFYHDKANWLGVDNAEIARRYLSDIQLSNADLVKQDSFAVKRTSAASWLQYEYQQRDFSFDVGARIENLTKEVAQAQQKYEFKNTEKVWLYSANLRYVINTDWQARINMSKNITPIQTEYFNPAAVYLPALGGYQTGSVRLSSYQGTQLSAQLSGTLGDSAELISSVYFKKLSGLVNYQRNESSGGVYFEPINDGDSWISGVDADFSVQFTPNFSVNASYSFADSERDYVYASVSQYSSKLEGLSKHVSHISLVYHRPKWGSQVSLSYRSNYINEVTYDPVLQEQVETGFFPYTRVNFSGYLMISDNVELTVGINNLTNDYYREYAGEQQYLYNTTLTGREYYLRLLLTI